MKNTLYRLRRMLAPAACILAFHTATAAPWTPQDLGDQIWLDWWAEDLPNGNVSAWTSRSGGVVAAQSTSSAQPVKQNGEVYFASGKRLTFGTLGSLVDGAPYPNNKFEPQINHKALVMLFRIADIQTASESSGSVFAINGYGGGWEQQPAVIYSKTNNNITVRWRTADGNTNALAFSVGSNPNQWHCLVARRDRDFHYASLDGKDADGNFGESKVAMSEWAMPKSNVYNLTSVIGDFRPNGLPHIAFDCILILQGDVSKGLAERLTGWAMWRRGIQGNLPADHPYKNVPPQSNGPKAPFVETTTAQWQTFYDWWNFNHYQNLRAHQGTPVDLTGWSLVFQDNFNSHTVTHDVRGKGNWFAPTHPAPAGVAQHVQPALNTSDPAVGTTGTPATYIHGSGTMTIRLQKDGNTWKGGTFASVNTNGHGRAWLYPYVEVRMKIGPSTTGSTKGAWPAFWLKSLNYFTNRTETNMEFDIYEGYISDANNHHHFSFHNWPAPRVLPGRLSSHRHVSHTRQVGQAPWNTALFDNQYHTYAAMVTPTETITYFDGLELGRFPTPVEMKQPLWLLTTLSIKGNEADQASGIFNLMIDYIRVYQNPAYADVSVAGVWNFNNSTAEETDTGLNALLVNGAGYSTDAVEGTHSLALNGSSQYAQLSPQNGTDFFHTAFKQRTFACWVKAATTSGSMVIYDDSGATEGLGLRINNSTLEFGAKSGGKFGSVSVPYTSTDWNHVACAYDNGTLTLYVNGVGVASQTFSNLGTVASRTSPAGLGARINADVFGNGTGHYFNGLIDRAIVYPEYLTATEIMLLSGQSSAPPPDVWFKLNNSAADAAGTITTGGLMNGAAYSTDAAEGSHSVVLNGSNQHFLISPTGASDLFHTSFQKRTFSVWAKANTTSGSMIIYDDSGGTEGLALRINNSTLQFGAKSKNKFGSLSVPYTSTDWNHIVGVYDTGTLTLYVNGINVASQTFPDLGTVGSRSSAAALGARIDSDIFGSGNGHYFNGRIDNLRVFQSALTAAEVMSLQ